MQVHRGSAYDDLLEEGFGSVHGRKHVSMPLIYRLVEVHFLECLRFQITTLSGLELDSECDMDAADSAAVMWMPTR